MHEVKILKHFTIVISANTINDLFNKYLFSVSSVLCIKQLMRWTRSLIVGNYVFVETWTMSEE